MLTLMLMRLLRIIMLTVMAARVALGEMEKPTHKHAKTSARRAGAYIRWGRVTKRPKTKISTATDSEHF
jgi:hypothetical protein